MPPRKKTLSGNGLSGSAFADRFELMVSNIGTVLKGKDDVVRMSPTGST